MPDDHAITSTTQTFLDIHDITNNIVLMKDGTASMIITVSALNFGLLAEEEQDAIIYSYAGLLNSLNYHIQIVIRSQTKDVTGYLHLLEDQIEKTPTKLLKDRIARYKDFVTNLIQERNVLDKKFYVVIPASPIELGILSAESVIPGVKTQAVDQIDRSVILEKARNNLEPKRDHLIGQFGRIGLYARQLETQEIIQLFYVSYNPEAGEGQQLTDSNSYTTPMVQARISGAGDLMADLTQAASPTPMDMGAPTTTPTNSAPAPVAAPVAPTPMSMGTTPTPMPTAPAMDMPAPAADVQNEINSTLQSLGTPAAMPTAPSMDAPAPAAPSMGMPMPAATPAMPDMSATQAMPAAPSMDATATAAPATPPAELPEI